MDPIGNFDTPVPLTLDDDSTGLASTDQAGTDQTGTEELAGEPSIDQADSFEEAPSVSSSPWSGGAQSLGDLLGQLRTKLGPATSALKNVDTAQSNSNQLDQGFGAIGKLASPLSKLAGALGWTEGAIKIPQASSQLDEAWKAYQHDPSTQNAQKLKAAFDNWRGAAQPLVEQVPSGPVGAQLGGLLEVATTLSGNMSVVLSERSEKAAAASQDQQVPAQEPQLVDPQIAKSNAKIQEDVTRDAAVPAFEDVPGELDRKLEAWRANNGLRELPARVQTARERVLDLYERMAAVREERSSNWNPSKRAELAEEEHRLSLQLREALGNLEVASSASASGDGRYLILENVKRAI